MEKFNETLKYYQSLFGLTNWTIKTISSDSGDGNHSAKTLADPRYHQATMTIYPGALVDEAGFDKIIVHELIHVVMAMYDFFADNLGKEDTDELFFIAREKSVSELTNIMMRLLDSTGKYQDL